VDQKGFGFGEGHGKGSFLHFPHSEEFGAGALFVTAEAVEEAMEEGNGVDAGMAGAAGFEGAAGDGEGFHGSDQEGVGGAERPGLAGEGKRESVGEGKGFRGDCLVFRDDAGKKALVIGFAFGVVPDGFSVKAVFVAVGGGSAFTLGSFGAPGFLPVSLSGEGECGRCHDFPGTILAWCCADGWVSGLFSGENSCDREFAGRLSGMPADRKERAGHFFLFLSILLEPGRLSKNYLALRQRSWVGFQNNVPIALAAGSDGMHSEQSLGATALQCRYRDGYGDHSGDNHGRGEP
jgi:hypothetical protein